MEELARKLGLRTNPTIFFVSAGIMVVFLIAILVAPGPIGDAFGAGRTWIVTNLGWFFIFGVTSWVAFLLYMALSRYGSIRLGGNDAKPEYGNISWFTMLFAGGIGTVLMFWGVAEPMSHFANPPRPDVEPFTVEAADDAMGFAIYHLGLHTWAIFTLPGLAFAYYIYRYDLPMRFSSVFYSLIGNRIYGRLGKALDIFAILGTLFGVAVSLGMGTQQINAGLTELLGVPNAVGTKVIIIGVLTTVAVCSIVAGLDKGIKVLSNINIGMAVGLMFFVLFAGSTVFLLRALVETFGIYITNFLPMSFWNDALAEYTHEQGGWGWQGNWTVFYWAWTVTWSPFIGIFVARISKGRTIREFVLGVLFAPSIFTLVWFAIFGWSAMEIDGIGQEARAALGDQAGALAQEVEQSIPLAIFAFFDHFPAATLIQGLSVVIVAIFFSTSSDSASLVVDMLCTGTPDPGPVHQRVFWGVSEGALAALLIVLAGEAGLTALQQVITVVGLPMFILVCVMAVALFRGVLRENISEVRVGLPPKVEELRE
ncbi:BCCT family transporter [Marinobacter nanhaiticus D15-8W]|uniref:BCCT family transporter n=1 Tax=Marinobacter nanhaiticus D15-8W TaxID=626887 RepID=N6VY33_9GAMM|nr:BCCT family transporter [Marinobacter nanhaiticus]ENO12769.1 BCCT family transporter [Marinobacter nanhaiticus D15-8W]BES70116.1 BCCT family transporter [Marinobacter nanhaiticus D15-8W]